MADTSESTNTRDKDHRLVYANAFHMAFGDNDVTITFGIDQRPQTGKKGMVEYSSVIMTPRTAKTIYKTLEHVINQYEKMRGEIELPDAKKAEIKSALRLNNAPIPPEETS